MLCCPISIFLTATVVCIIKLVQRKKGKEKTVKPARRRDKVLYSFWPVRLSFFLVALCQFENDKPIAQSY